MFTTFIAVLCALAVLVSPVTAAGAEAVYIDSEAELCAFSAAVAAGNSFANTNVHLGADIRLTAPFTPIGNGETPFCGTFHGNGYTIYDLRVEGGDSPYNGLFGCVVGGSISDVRLKNVAVSGGNYCGGLVGRAYSYEGYFAITGCYVSGTVSGTSYVGGITGLALSAAHGIYAELTVTDSTFNGVASGDIYTGGIAGKAEAISTASRAEAVISGCRADGRVSAVGRYGTMAGGICGAVSAKSNGGSTIARAERSLSYADVSAETAAAGGISGAVGGAGLGASAAVTDSVSLGTVRAAALAGGIAGKCEQAEDGAAAVTGCVAGATLIGTDLYPIAAGTGITGCFTSEDKDITFPVEIQPSAFRIGDVNGDGYTDNLDAALILKYDAGLALLGISAKEASDYNGDGLTDNLDASLILKFDAGL